jgi:hypothetical protein
MDELSAGIWSTDNQRALDVAGQLEAGRLDRRAYTLLLSTPPS